MTWQELTQIFNQVVVQTYIQHLLFQSRPFFHESDCFLHTFFQFFVLLDKFGDLLVLAANYFFEFALLIFHSAEFLLIKFLKFEEVAFGDVMILILGLFLIDLMLHMISLKFSIHLVHSWFKSMYSIFENTDLLQIF